MPRRLVLASVLVAALIACGSFSGNGGGNEISDASDGGDEAAIANATDGATEASVNGGACDTIFVSGANGLDANDGCTKETAKRTLGNAIALAKAVPPKSGAIDVCSGTYDETLLVDVPVSIRGSFDCTTFTRPEDAGPAATITPTTKLVSTQAAMPNVSPSTLTLSGAAITSAVVIDGLEIVGADVGGSSAVFLTSGAAPTLDASLIRGGAGNADDNTTTFPEAKIASIGIRMNGRAGGTFAGVRLLGGTGHNTAVGGFVGGSVALYANDAAPFTLRDSFVDGDSGSGATGSIGVFSVPGTNTKANEVVTIQRNRIGGGHGAGNDSGASIGILISGDPRFLVLDNELAGGTGSCGAGQCIVTAMTVVGTPAVHVLRNRIVSGSFDTPGTLSSYGINFGGAPQGAPEIVNNLFLVDGATAALVGISLNGPTTNAAVQANTFVSSTISKSVGITLIWQGGAPDGTLIESNLFGQLGAAFTFGTTSGASPCAGNTLVHNNGFVETPTLFAADAACNQLGSPSAASISALESFFGAAAGKNIRVGSPAECSSDSSACIVLNACTPSASACFGTVFAEDPTIASLLAPPGVSLSGTAPCEIVQGGKKITGLTDDALGATRKTPTAVGAIEGTTCSN